MTKESNSYYLNKTSFKQGFPYVAGKNQRSREDRREDTKRRKFNDPNDNMPGQGKIPCRRSGKERRAK